MFIEYELIIVIVIIVLFLYLKSNKEFFTNFEMQFYPESLKINCKKSTEINNQLKHMNKMRCGKKGTTDKDTINNKWVCYDDIGKEIVSGLDAESNCVMSDIVNKQAKSKSVPKPAQKRFNDPTPINTQNMKPSEGPDFINKFFIPAYDLKKSDGYQPFSTDEQIGSAHKYPAMGPYDDTSLISSDPNFLKKLADYKSNL